LRYLFTAGTHTPVKRLSLIGRAVLGVAFLFYIELSALAATPRSTACARVEFTGMVNTGEEWKTSLGEGWVFRVLPIVPGSAGYTGWDLVVDRDPPAGYPDALLLATPPYNTLNDREIGTTFGLRAQDAISWNPRSFHFLTNPAAFKEGQNLFLELSRRLSGGATKAGDNASVAQLTGQLNDLRAGAAAGELRILDAGIAPGIADPAPIAQHWAQEAAYQSYMLVPESGSVPSPRGELAWIRFSITLWLPSGWKLPPNVDSSPARCPR
jgi:hypothetical protein